MKILKALESYLRSQSLLESNDLVVAYSGGLDSHVLLHALSVLRDQMSIDVTIHAIHIHHGLSPKAGEWQAHCQSVCAELNILFSTAKIQLTNTSRTSLEALAREARYKQIVELASNDAFVLLGQHEDDQLETFLLQLKRGAGPKGLASMNPKWVVEENKKNVIFGRPLLDISQQDILDYAEKNNLNWCEDDSNQDTKFDRNFLRHDVLPILQNRWPELAKSVSRSAQLCAQQQVLLDEVCIEKLASLKRPDNSLCVNGLILLSEHWLYAVVRYWLSEQNVASPSLLVMQQLRPQVLIAADDAAPILQWQNWQFRRFNQQLYLVQKTDVFEPINMTWQGEAELPLPGQFGRLTFTAQPISGDSLVKFDPSIGPITLKTGGFSQKFKPNNSPHSKPLKQWFKQWKIPPWQRDRCIQLIQDERIIALYINDHWIVSASSSLNNNKGINKDNTKYISVTYFTE
ncbi:tRNA lysidine(34) synthetase TilS [Paraglaciecola sp.]|uniref:tRNA lysidine(34) synthetase TilS n=1 Tax=Paraglaciecola sp. TaxID=1920173 RepID=UPI003EF4CD06